MPNLIVLLILVLSGGNCHKMNHEKAAQLLNPQILRPYMFQSQISGKLNFLTPHKVNTDKQGRITSEEYVIDMMKTSQQILPEKLFNKTTIYAYGGPIAKGYYTGFPGPAIIATKDRPIKVTWRNMIRGPHLLPVDFNYPFINDSAFRNEVPTVPHVHGLFVSSESDGGPEAYWTISGQKGMDYFTEEKCPPNYAIYIYPNEQTAGNFWFHDHAYGITRLNVYAGLIGLYKIIDPKSKKQREIYDLFGISEDETNYLIVTDKSFKTNGDLFYGGESTNPSFSNWMPEFFGNTMLVNGVLWPKLILKQSINRIVFLNGCQGRFLNIWFENKGKKIPFQLIRVDGNFYDQPVTVTELLATISSRIEFILDLSNVEGEILLKNNAPVPYPNGDEQNFNDEFNGNIMKIIVNSENRPKQYRSYNFEDKKESRISKKDLFYKKIKVYSQSSAKYPAFGPGQKVYMTLFEVMNSEGDVEAAFINGISMMSKMGMDCPNSTYRVGKTYDFYFINLTPDAHPIHFHLINMQKVKQFRFDKDEYSKKYFEMNGGIPTKYGWEDAPFSLDPEQFRSGQDEFPKEDEKVFRDTIDVFPGYVTVMRVKFAKNDGSLAKTFGMRGQKYVLHCHILEHQDNIMMINYCLE